MPTLQELYAMRDESFAAIPVFISEIEALLCADYGALKHLRSVINKPEEFKENLRSFRKAMRQVLLAAQQRNRIHLPHQAKPKRNFGEVIRDVNVDIFGSRHRGINELAFSLGIDTVETLEKVMDLLIDLEIEYYDCGQLCIQIMEEKIAIKTVAA